MHMKTEQDIIKLIQNDTWMIEVLQTVKSLQLPDWWVCAGYYVYRKRNKYSYRSGDRRHHQPIHRCRISLGYHGAP